MLEPFTLEHFRAWAAELELDSGDLWVLEPFQEAFLTDVFVGFPECWLIVPEGNTKTTTLAGLGLYHCEFKPTAAVPIAAASREQAEVMYRQAEGIVMRSTRLSKVFKCQEGYRRIKHLGNGSRIQVFAADDRTGDGIIPTLAMLDELHRHRDLRLYRTWRGKLGKRKGQIATISTAGEPGGEFEETRERIRQGADEFERDGSFVRAVAGGVVLHEYAVPEGSDVEDMAVVKLANPFSGVTLADLAEKRTSATMTLSHWRRFVCNLPTRDTSAAITEAEWDGAEVDAEFFPEGAPSWLGLDVAYKWDTTAAVPFIINSPEDRVFGEPRILVPPRDGSSMSPRVIEEALLDLHERNPIHTVVMDSHRAEWLISWIEDNLGATVVDRSQTPPNKIMDYDRFTQALRKGWLKHTGDETLRRHVLNALATTNRNGETRFDRPSQSRRDKTLQDSRVIDALDAAAMVNSVAEADFESDFVFDLIDPYAKAAA